MATELHEVTVYMIKEKQENGVYQQLIDFFRKNGGKYFILAERSTFRKKISLDETVDSLDKFLIEKDTSAHEWPGTLINEGPGNTVYKYRLDKESAEILKKATDNIFGWLMPELPEDLSIFREDDTPLLVCTTHETEAWLYLTDKEDKILRTYAPKIALDKIDKTS